MAHVQGGDCFCLGYLLSDESRRIALTQKTMKMVCVVFCASLLGTHICRESCLPQSSTQALPKDAKWQSIQISPPSGDGVDQIPKRGEQKINQMPHICPTPPPPPPPLGLTLIGPLQNH
jgi:hypothetical protein